MKSNRVECMKIQPQVITPRRYHFPVWYANIYWTKVMTAALVDSKSSHSVVYIVTEIILHDQGVKSFQQSGYPKRGLGRPWSMSYFKDN